MRRLLVGIALACGFAGVMASSAFALRVAIAPPAPVQLSKTDAVVVGRVVGVEPMDVEAAPAKNQAKVNYRIAVVQVTEAVFGLKVDTKMVRIGFIAPPMNPNGVPPGGVIQPGVIQIQPAIQPGIVGRRPFPGGVQNVTLNAGQEGMFMLTKHPTADFYTLPGFNAFVNSQNNPNFANEVKSTKEYCKVLADTTGSLKSEDAQTRFMAASVLISMYRSNPTGQPMKEERISAEESKLILTALAKADWNVNRANSKVQAPADLFNQLGINQNDGFQLMNVRTQQDVHAGMQKWLAENSDKYIVKKLVVDPNAKIQPVDVPPMINPGVRPPIRIQPKGKIQIQPLPAPVPGQIQIQPIQIQIDLPAQPIQGLPIQVRPVQAVPVEAPPISLPAPVPQRD